MSGAAGRPRVALVVDVDESVGGSLRAALDRSGYSVIVGAGDDDLALDSSDPISTERLARRVADEHGSIDVLINGLRAVARGVRRTWNEIEPEEWDHCFAIIVPESVAPAAGPWRPICSAKGEEGSSILRRPPLGSVRLDLSITSRRHRRSSG